MDDTIMYDPANITLVREACDCDEEEAIDLLKRAKNIPKRAIKLRELHSKYRRNASPRPPYAFTPSTPQSEASDARIEHPNGEQEESTDVLAAQDPTNGYPQQTLTDGTTLHHQDAGQVCSTVAGYTTPMYDFGATKQKQGRQDVEYAEHAPAWDLILPVVHPQSLVLTSESLAEYDQFNLREAVACIQSGANIRAMQQYFGRFDRDSIAKHINDEIEGFPAMFYAVETNKEDMLRFWASYGGDVAAVHKPSRVPLLAFAIMHGDNIQADTTLMTATLLSLGASPSLIPSAFYSPYLQDLPEHGPNNDSLSDLTDEQKVWCKDAARGKLARACSLSQRYYLERARKTNRPSRRKQQVAERAKAEPLLGIANLLIGQTTAAKTLLDTLLTHLIEPGKKPLVLVFAGPSGHGKTELARRLGHLLSLELEVVDCTVVSREMELFGPRHPYVNAEQGSPLNNFLAKHHEERCIVFLDEFEKSGPEIHKALLLPFENGEYQDRRNLSKINCSKTIWILATNAHDPIIQDFSTANSKVLFSEEDEAETKRLLKQLSRKIREDFQHHHGPPITGRISEFLPFLTFSVGEQSVIVHKALLELSRKVRQPVNLSEGDEEKLLGNVRLRIRRDASLCRTLAESEYHSDLGARSLIAAAEKIKRMLVEEYLKVDEEITEGDRMTEFVLDVSGGEVVVNLVPPKGR